MPYSYRQFYRRKLPHIHPPGADLFITFRLAGAVPKSVLAEWRAEREWLEHEITRIKKESRQSGKLEVAKHEHRLLEFSRKWFIRFEEILHRAEHGPTWLKDERIAKLVADSLHYRDGKVFQLDCYCIMSNHVHVVFRPSLTERNLHEKSTAQGLVYESDEPPVGVIMHSLKSFTANEANKLLGRSGAFWEAESYDHVIGGELEFHRIRAYVLNNPVKAGLVRDWREWRWSWSRTNVRQAASLSML